MSYYASRVALSAALVALMARPPVARAAGDPPPEKPAEPPAEAPPPDKKRSPATAGPDGFAVQSENGDYRLQLRAYLQFDGRFFPVVDTFLIRRARPIFAGTLAKYFDFQIMPDFAQGTTTLYEAWVDFNYTPKARVRVGKFKSPVGLERLQSAMTTAFVERAFPTALVPNRDVGVQLYGDLDGGVVTYAVGLFDGAPDGANIDLDLNDGKDVAGRLFISPFKNGQSALKNLGFGIAGTYGRQSGALAAYRSGGQVSILTLLSGEPALEPKAIDLLKASSSQHCELVVKAWQTTATVTLTGDAASYSGVRPRNPFDPPKGHWGAVELAARVNGLEVQRAAVSEGLIDPTRSVRKAFAWAVGLNWYLNRNVKEVVDYERTTFTGGAAGGDRPAENALFFRTQLSF